jgi:hypothetical protein
VWVATIVLPGGLGSSTLTLGATFDGAEIVAPRSLPIATDSWNGGYAGSVTGGCAMGGASRTGGARLGSLALVAAALLGRRRRR